MNRDHNFLIHPSVVRHLGHFQTLVIITSTAIYKGVCVICKHLFKINPFVLLLYKDLGVKSNIFYCLLFWNISMLFSTDLTRKQKVPISIQQALTHPPMTFCTDVRWNIIVILLWGSVIIDDEKQFFRCFLASTCPLRGHFCLAFLSIFLMRSFTCCYWFCEWVGIFNASPLSEVCLVQVFPLTTTYF